MSHDYEFSMRRSWAGALAGCLAAVGVLIFLAGTVTGLIYSEAHGKTATVAAPLPFEKSTKSDPGASPHDKTEAVQTPSVPEPSAAVAPPSVAAVSTPPAAAVPVSTAPTGSAEKAPPEHTGSAVAATSAPPSSSATKPVAPSGVVDSEVATAPPARASLAIPLAVQLGAFAIKSNAETLVQSLGDKGYKPLVSRSTDARGRQWYIVRLGPYDKWAAATRVAARISLTEDVKPVIGPMR